MEETLASGRGRLRGIGSTCRAGKSTPLADCASRPIAKRAGPPARAPLPVLEVHLLEIFQNLRVAQILLPQPRVTWWRCFQRALGHNIWVQMGRAIRRAGPELSPARDLSVLRIRLPLLALLQLPQAVHGL